MVLLIQTVGDKLTAGELTEFVVEHEHTNEHIEEVKQCQEYHCYEVVLRIKESLLGLLGRASNGCTII